MLRAIQAVFIYELARAFQPSRMTVGLIPVLFPVALLASVRNMTEALLIEQAIVITFILVPQVLCLLTLLRSAVPLIQSEIEAQSWIYLSLRPLGKQAVVLGKYLAAVALSIAGGVCSTLISGVTIVERANAVEFIWPICCLVVLSSIAYGALYVLIGVLFQKRGMVIAFAYTLLVEVVVSAVPATINQFTVSYRLRSLLYDWVELPLPTSNSVLIGSESATVQIAKLLIFTTLLLGAAVTIVRFRELPLHADA